MLAMSRDRGRRAAEERMTVTGCKRETRYLTLTVDSPREGEASPLETPMQDKNVAAAHTRFKHRTTGSYAS